jgi:hypothetical protein
MAGCHEHVQLQDDQVSHPVDPHGDALTRLLYSRRLK